MNIDYVNLRQLDLNLLVALDALITEASVTRAAEKLDMSQSAMSYSLKRLRVILNDEILVRTSRKMEVTTYARQIGDRVRQILTEIQSTLLENEVFNPAMAKKIFKIAASDYVEATIGTRLIGQLTNKAPGIRIRISNLAKETVMNVLDNNQLDIVINPQLSLKSWHVKEDLYREEFVCVVRGDDSLTELPITDYLDQNHILVSMRDDFQGAGDKILERQQQSRQVIWSTSHFMTVPFLLANSDCAALLPKRMAQQCAKAMNLRLFAPPIEIDGFTVSMVWHQRNNNNPQHQWLRQQIIDAAQNIS
ncbi:LysR family transcriptional regulator [Lusitaniella coriacea]|uniref:LysR family transcriptional regulator n=1 Tax=Lusitaniella coriacea TaxID=1983105 RepID=UPI003CEBF692